MKILRKIIMVILVIFGVMFIFEKINKSFSDLDVEVETVEVEEKEIEEEEIEEEAEPQIMATGDNGHVDSTQPIMSEAYIDSIIEEFNYEVDRIIDEAIYESLSPDEQFVYGLQSALTSYTDSVYKQYGDPDRSIDYINADIKLSKYFTDLYNYKDIKTNEDLISSIESSKFRSVCDRTIGDAIYGNLDDVEYFIDENGNLDEEIEKYVTYIGMDEDTGNKYSIKFNVYDSCISINSVYCNNRSVGGLENVLATAEYILR